MGRGAGGQSSYGCGVVSGDGLAGTELGQFIREEIGPGTQDLDRDVAAEYLVDGAEDDAHAALPQFTHDAVAPAH